VPSDPPFYDPQMSHWAAAYCTVRGAADLEEQMMFCLGNLGVEPDNSQVIVRSIAQRLDVAPLVDLLVRRIAARQFRDFDVCTGLL